MTKSDINSKGINVILRFYVFLFGKSISGSSFIIQLLFKVQM